MNKLFKRFYNKYINIIMKNVKGAQVLNDGVVVEGNVIIEGYLLDEDEDFYYLGTNDTEIDEALRKIDVVRIFVPSSENELNSFNIENEESH